MRLQTQAQIHRLDEEKAELAAAAAARHSEAERQLIEAKRQLSEADTLSRAEQEQLLLQTANLERLTAEVAHRRAEVEASLHKANEEDERMLEMQQATEQRRLEAAAQIRRFDEEKAGLKTAVEAVRRNSSMSGSKRNANSAKLKTESVRDRRSFYFRRPTSNA